MASLKFVVLLCAVALVTSLPQQYGAPGGGGGGIGGGGGGGQGPLMPYDFEYVVNAPEFGNDYGHREQSDGDVVQGQYYVLLPDGRRQIVTYRVTRDSGYVADVQYEGEATFPNGGGGGGGGGGGLGGGYN